VGEGLPLVEQARVLCIYCCKSDKKQTQPETVDVEKNNVIEIITENMEFQMADTIPSGWNTFHYWNLSPQTHFFLVGKLPEGRTSEDAQNFTDPVFDRIMELKIEGKTEEGNAEYSKLPDWWGEVFFLGGSGLLSPNQVGVTTLNLRPGKYIMECYVKMSNGVSHTSMGMYKDFVVSEAESGYEEPISDFDISVSITDGIIFNDSINSGNYIFSVLFKDEIVGGNIGPDIHLVQLDENANLKELENWMVWDNPNGLREPAPSAVTFMGGVNDTPVGNIGYFTATFEPGNYAFISEERNAISKNLLKTFVVSE
jgi:hypothetical protein